MEKQIFQLPINIYWEDTDAGGVVYHSQYLNFAERARTEFIKGYGVKSQRQFAKETGIKFVVKSIEVNYKSPAFLDDELLVSCSPIKFNGASIIFEQSITRDEKELVHLLVKVASINDDGVPVKLPSVLLSGANV